MINFCVDASKVRVYENLMALCDFAGEERSFGDRIWQGILEDEELYREMTYFMDNENLCDAVKRHGYSLVDLFVWQMGKSNLLRDTGKNTLQCNKISMVLRSFYMMLELTKNPEETILKLEEGRGMDKL